MENTYELKCPFCGIKACKTENEKKPPKFCPMPLSEELMKETLNMYAALNLSVIRLLRQSFQNLTDARITVEATLADQNEKGGRIFFSRRGRVASLFKINAGALLI